ncbi:MAG: DUF1064 domain-containing protein, partial [Roseibium sp.]
MVERMTAADILATQSQPKSQKYGAQRTVVDGVTFDSKKEAARWAQLCLLQRAGQISDLKRQVVVPLVGRDGPLLSRKGRQMRI